VLLNEHSQSIHRLLSTCGQKAPSDGASWTKAAWRRDQTQGFAAERVTEAPRQARRDKRRLDLHFLAGLATKAVRRLILRGSEGLSSFSARAEGWRIGREARAARPLANDTTARPPKGAAIPDGFRTNAVVARGLKTFDCRKLVERSSPQLEASVKAEARVGAPAKAEQRFRRRITKLRASPSRGRRRRSGGRRRARSRKRPKEAAHSSERRHPGSKRPTSLTRRSEARDPRRGRPATDGHATKVPEASPPTVNAAEYAASRRRFRRRGTRLHKKEAPEPTQVARRAEYQSK